MERKEKVLEKLSPEMKKKVEDKAITYFECRLQSRPQCKCGRNKTTSMCHFPLRGSKEGEVCGKLLCDICGETIDGKTYCRPHAKMIRKECGSGE